MEEKLIDADKLLHEYLEQYTAQERNGNLVFSVAEIKQNFADILNAAPTIEVPRWIPVTERLPERQDMFLVSHYGIVTAAWFYTTDRWELPSGFVTDAVTHWMPLPQPPKDGDT